MTICNTRSFATTDAAGRPTTITDAMAQVPTMVYDDANRNTKQHFADGTRVTNSYDALGRIATEAYSLGVITNATLPRSRESLMST